MNNVAKQCSPLFRGGWGGLLLFLIALLPLISLAQANQDVYYARRATLFEQLPVGKKDIIMLGNSLTDGAEWNELMRNSHVKNRGIVGDIIQGYYERMEPILKGQDPHSPHQDLLAVNAAV